MRNSSRSTQDNSSFEHELAGKYLTVSLSREKYGLPITPIEDIIEMQEITSVPQTTDFLEGVINLRGTVIPVLDLRKKFGLETSSYDRRTCLVVVTIENVKTGLIVDSVHEVADFADGEIDPARNMGGRIRTRFIAGMGKTDDAVVILLDLEEVLEKEEVEELEEIAEEETRTT